MSFARARGSVLAVWLVAVVALAGAVSCATTPADPAAARTAVEQERALADLRAQNAGYARQVEELQNRIFILEGKIEAEHRVADREKSLPGPKVKRIVAPPLEEPPSGPEGDAPLVAGEPGTVVEYAGAAAAPGRRRARPVLRLSGSGTRVAIVESRAPSSQAASPGNAPAASPTGALRLYHGSLVALHERRHADALAGFRRFLALYGGHRYSDNAQYWIGECYYDLRQYHAAMREFRRVLQRYPNGNKASEAMLKIGYAHLALGDERGGRQVLVQLRRNYSRSLASRLAQERLTAMNEGPAQGPAGVGSGAPKHASEGL